MGYRDMFQLSNLYIEFDELTRIAHLTGKDKISINTQHEMTLFYNWLFSELDTYIDDGRIYLVSDLNKIYIDPQLADMYAAKSKLLMEKYIYPCGIARYGYEITRVTIIHGYRDILQKDPNLFSTRYEAYAYIYGLIRKNRKPTTEPVKSKSELVSVETSSVGSSLQTIKF